jgi:hypothetical protein
MRSRLIGGLLSFALATLAIPAFAQTSDKKPPTKKEKLVAIGMYAGKVLEVDEENKTFKLRVQGKTGTPTFRPGNPSS